MNHLFAQAPVFEPAPGLTLRTHEGITDGVYGISNYIASAEQVYEDRGVIGYAELAVVGMSRACAPTSVDTVRLHIFGVADKPMPLIWRSIPGIDTPENDRGRYCQPGDLVVLEEGWLSKLTERARLPHGKLRDILKAEASAKPKPGVDPGVRAITFSSVHQPRSFQFNNTGQHVGRVGYESSSSSPSNGFTLTVRTENTGLKRASLLMHSPYGASVRHMCTESRVD